MLKRLLGDSIALVFGNLETVFKACGAWFAVQLAGFGAIAAMGLQGPAAVLFGLLPILIVSFAASASIAVAWHRFGLLNENPEAIHLKLGSLESRFILKSLMLTLMMAACVFVLGVFHAVTGSAAVTGLAALVLMVVALPAFLRFSLILPATAVGLSIGIGDAYRIGEGLGWRMFSAIFLLSLPFALISEALAYLLELSEGGLPVILIQMKVLILNVLSQIILMVLSISVLTSAFRIAMERHPAESFS